MLVGALAATAWLVVDSRGAPAEPPSRPLPSSALVHEDDAVPVARHPRLVDLVDAEAAPPRRITIPRIGVSARVVGLARAPDGAMETPTDFDDVGWYRPGPEPGEAGAAVMAGHVDSTSGPAVFYRLGDLRRGDRIRIQRGDGTRVTFWVEGLERRPKAAFPSARVFRRTRIAALRLVTCSGGFDESTGHYLDNTIVYAARVPVRRNLP